MICDVSNVESIAAAAVTVKATLSEMKLPLVGLVNNAGVQKVCVRVPRCDGMNGW